MRTAPKLHAIVWERLLAGALLGIHGLLGWLGRPPGVLTGEDEAIYSTLAREVTHLRYADAYLVGAPPHTMYPPGYPTLLAVWGAFGTSFDWRVALSVLASVTALGAMFVVVRRSWGRALAVALLAALAVNPALVRNAGLAMSEAPFLALGILAVAATQLEHRSASWVAGAAALGTALTRSVGVALIPALGLLWLWRRRYRAVALLGVGAVATVGAWQWHSLRAPEQYVARSYAADFFRGDDAAAPDTGPAPPALARRVIGRLRDNAGMYALVSIPRRMPMPNVAGTRVDNAAAILLTALGLVPGLFLLGRRWPAAVFYLGAYGMILAIWPWQVGRFVEPLVPLLVLAALLGWGAVAARFRPRWEGRVRAAAAACLALTGIAVTQAQLRAPLSCLRGVAPQEAQCLGPEQRTYLEAVRFLRDSVPSGAVVYSAKPATVFHYSGHRGVQPPVGQLPPPEQFVPFLRESGVSFVLLGSVHSGELSRLAPAVEHNCESLRVRRNFPPFTTVFTVTEPGLAGSDACAVVREFQRLTQGQTFDFGW